MSLTSYQTEFLNRILSIPSVGSEPEEGAPYGRRSREVLEVFLEEAGKAGFKTGVIDDKVGWIEFGSGDRLTGIVCHLDVVPEGSGWSSDPFVPSYKDGAIYCRGIVDDKGPACAAFFAMKDLLEKDIAPGSRVRLILGTDEERTCDCVETYAAKGELPDIAITPDAEFPVIYAEKGILHVKITDPSGSDAFAYGGEAANMVPASAEFRINGKQINASGKMAHASKPELGINAIDSLPALIKAEGLDTAPYPLLAFIEKYMTSGDHEALTGCTVKDDSGELTANTGILRLDENGGYIVIDIRYPVTASYENIMECIGRAASAYGLVAEADNHMAPLYKDRRSNAVSILTDIWKDHMDRFTDYKPEYSEMYAEPIAIGGGTYARHMPNTIAFGIQTPWQEDQCHQANEHMSVNDFEECIKILEEAILKLSAN